MYEYQRDGIAELCGDIFRFSRRHVRELSDERARVLCSLLFCLSSAIDEYFYAEHNFDLSQLHNRRPHTRHRGRIHKAPPVAIHNLHVHHWDLGGMDAKSPV